MVAVTSVQDGSFNSRFITTKKTFNSKYFSTLYKFAVLQ